MDVFIQQRYKKKKCIHFQPDCLSFSLSLSGILMVSMNNILQVSSRSSLALPRRKLSNSRQVIPLHSLECSKSCSERFIVNGKKHAKKKRHTLQSRCDCNHKLILMPCHQDCDCVSSDFFFFFVSPFIYFFFFSSGERFCQRQVHQPGWYHPSSCRDSGWWMCKHYWGDHHSNSLCRWTQNRVKGHLKDKRCMHE